MNPIEQQIKELQKKQEKIQVITRVNELVKSGLKEVDFSDQETVNEVLKEVEIFCREATERVINSVTHKSPVKKVQEPTADHIGGEDEHEENTTPVKAVEKQVDKLSFAMNHKHLSEKAVKVKTPDGFIQGVVRGANAPHLIIEMSGGRKILARPEEIVLEG